MVISHRSSDQGPVNEHHHFHNHDSIVRNSSLDESDCHSSPVGSDNKLPDSHSETSQISPSSNTQDDSSPQDLSLRKKSGIISPSEHNEPSSPTPPHENEAFFNNNNSSCIGSAAEDRRPYQQQLGLNRFPNDCAEAAVLHKGAVQTTVSKEFCNKYYLQTHKATKHGLGVSMSGIAGLSGLSNLTQMFEQQQQANFAAAMQQQQHQQEQQLMCPLCGQGCQGQLALQTHIVNFHNPMAPSPQQQLQQSFSQGGGNPLALYMQMLANGGKNCQSPLGLSISSASPQHHQQQQQQPSMASGGILNGMQLMSGLLQGGGSQGSMFPGAMLPTMPSVSQPGIGGQLSMPSVSAAGMDSQNAHMVASGLSALAAALGVSSQASALTTTTPQRATTPTCVGMIQHTPNVHTSMGSLLSAAAALDKSPNKEAYCDICEKEFCNKYFLKTHMQKKHGIETSPITSAEKRSSQDMTDGNGMMLNGSEQGEITSGHYENGRRTPPMMNGGTPGDGNSQGGMDCGGGPDAKSSKLENAPPSNGYMQQHQQHNDLKPKCSLDSLLAGVPFGSQAGQCDVCPKSFRSLFELATHKFREHAGGLSLPVGSTSSIQFGQQQSTGGMMSHSPLLPTLSSLAAQLNSRMDQSPAKSVQSDNNHNTQNDGMSRNEQSYCELCEKEFCNKAFLQQHKIKMHGMKLEEMSPIVDRQQSTPVNNGNDISSMDLSSPSLNKLQLNSLPSAQALFQQQIQQLQQQHQLMGLQQQLQQSPNSHLSQQMGGVVTPTQQQFPNLPISNQSGQQKPKRVYSSGKNFCDLCNKEVCNKYFLRTHMLKMHGIVIDENKVLIGNIDTLEKEKTGTISFRCDICMKELTTRQLLRAHKQDVHGIMPLSTPPTGRGRHSHGEKMHHSSGGSFSSAQSMVMTSGGGAPGSAMLPTMVSLLNGQATAPPNVTVTTAQMGSRASSASLDAMAGGGKEKDSPFESYGGNFTEVCPVCDSRFKSAGQLNMHMRMEHANEVPEEVLASFQQAAEQAEESSGRGGDKFSVGGISSFGCDYCPMEFGDVIEHQLHLINSHAEEVRARADEKHHQRQQHGADASSSCGSEGTNNTSGNNSGKPDSELGPLIMQNNQGTKLFRCTYCTYYTRWPSNLSTHEKRHTMGTASSEKPHVCNICLREYRYAHSLERHKEVHRLSASYERKFGSPEKHSSSPEKAHHHHGLSPSKLVKRFPCSYCDKRFRTRDHCREHVFAVHRRGEIYSKRPRLEDSPGKKLLYQTAADENKAVVSSVVESLHAQLEQARRSAEHENTSGSTSPNSDKSHRRKLPEGFAQPMSAEPTTKKEFSDAGQQPMDDGASVNGAGQEQQQQQEEAKPPSPFVMQSFIMRAQNESGDDNDVDVRGQFMQEMVAHLPVRQLVDQSVRVTFTLLPAPNMDAQVKHL